MEYTGLSKRGIELVPKEPNPLVVYLNEYGKDPFDAEANPKGIIDCGVAENDVVSDIILEKLKEVHQKLRPVDLRYTGFQGNPDLRQAISSFFNRHFHVNTNPDNIVITDGTGTALNNLATVLCDPNDGILLPTPFYGAYLLDMTLLPKTKIITVPTRYEDRFVLSIDTLTQVYDDKTSQGETIKALLITNPNNPTGIGHNHEELTQLIDWAKQRRVHLIVNEIYALSSFKRAHSTILKLLDTMKDDDFVRHYVHFTYGFAKDFGVSGLRLSFAYSLNDHVVAAMGQSLSFFTTSSRQTQACFTHILNDEQWMDYYTKELKERLVCASSIVKEKLDAEKIKYLEPEGGLFIVLDLRSYLKENTFEAEKELFEHLFFKHKIYVNYGHSFGFTEPGFFRVIFSRLKPTMEEAVNRIAAGLKSF